jgi:hypothetical protein
VRERRDPGRNYPMFYQILGGVVILLHFLWILFLLFGVLLAIRSPRIGWIHVGGLLLSLLLNGLDLYCPLTYLENYLHSFYDRQSSYTGSFIVHYLEYLIYPNLP